MGTPSKMVDNTLCLETVSHPGKVKIEHATSTAMYLMSLSMAPGPAFAACPRYFFSGSLLPDGFVSAIFVLSPKPSFRCPNP